MITSNLSMLLLANFRQRQMMMTRERLPEIGGAQNFWMSLNTFLHQRTSSTRIAESEKIRVRRRFIVIQWKKHSLQTQDYNAKFMSIVERHSVENENEKFKILKKWGLLRFLAKYTKQHIQASLLLGKSVQALNMNFE